MTYCVEIDPYYAERSGEFFYAIDRVPFVDMATAISRIYVADGFMVAADGRERNTETGFVASDSEQKIFCLHHRRGDLACAVTGAARIGEHYRLSQDLPEIAAALENSDAQNIGEYAEQFGNDLKRSIYRRCSFSKKTLTIYPLLDGYIGNRPGRAKVTITCAPIPVPVGVESQELFPGMSIGFGSDIIQKSLFASTLQHEPLRQYWEECRQGVRTLDQSAAVARTIIAAHCDPRVAELDPKIHDSVGGHIHVAEITTKGFRWRIPPEDKSTPVVLLDPRRDP
jgi:hypothetical protein